MSGGRAEGKGKKKKKGQTVTSRAPVTPVSEARSPPSPALRAIPRTCWCLRCSLCAGGEKKKKKKTQVRLCFSDPVGQARAEKDGQFAFHCSDE